MNPILCHLCNKPLIRTKWTISPEETRWACYYSDENDSFSIEDESEDLSITTLPKKRGVVIKYFATIKHKGNIYYLQSFREDNKTTLYQLSYSNDIGLYHGSSDVGVVPRFYNLKLKEPLAPQFEKIFENVKLCLIFS